MSSTAFERMPKGKPVRMEMGPDGRNPSITQWSQPDYERVHYARLAALNPSYTVRYLQPGDSIR